MLYPIILSGGVGKRLWPVSSQTNPKQFQKLFNNKTLIQNTYDRILKGFDKNNIFVITNINSSDYIKDQLDIDNSNILLEPEAKGTAMAIGLVTTKLYSLDKEAILVNINSDAYIKEVDKYLEVIKQAAKVASDRAKMVLVGIKPRYPETGYGYIELGDKDNIASLFKIASFKEKPDLDKAKEFVEDGKYLWNPTLLVFSAKKLLEWYSKFLPKIYKSLIKIQEANFSPEIIAKEYAKSENISIDYGLLEKMDDMLVISTDITWADIGSWRSLRDVLSNGKKDNVSNVKNISIDSSNNLLYSSSDKLIATLGVEDMVLVETDEVIFLCPAERSQDLKILLEKMKKEKLDKYL